MKQDFDIVFLDEHLDVSDESFISREEALTKLNSMDIRYSSENAAYTLRVPSGVRQVLFVSLYGTDKGSISDESATDPLLGGASKVLNIPDDAAEGDTVTIPCTAPIQDGIGYLNVQASVSIVDGDDWVTATGVIEIFYSTEDGEGGETGEGEPIYIHPTGVVPFKSLPVLQIGFANHQSQTTYTHIQMRCAEILDDGTVGGEGHVWESGFCDKDIDYTTTLDALRSMCEGKDITHFNVSYILLSLDESGNYNVIGSYIVGGDVNVVTFSVTDNVEGYKSGINLKDTAYCLDPVLLAVNRRDMPEIQHVTVEVQDYKADFEFYPDRNVLEIDIAEYLQVLFAHVDLFEHQQLTATVVVKLYNADWEHMETQGITVTAIYGKNPDPALPNCKIRVQWLDKYAVLHDEYFRIVDNQTEGASKMKYIGNREEREDKTGEKSITLAKVLANNTEREALKTIVFADHVRAYIGEAWKRVQIANTYKTGAGREKQNFEITIKYSL